MGQVCIMSAWILNVNMDAGMKEAKMAMGNSEESGDCLASSMQITWFYAASQRKT